MILKIEDSALERFCEKAEKQGCDVIYIRYSALISLINVPN